LCTNYVELVLKSSVEKGVGRTLSQVGKSPQDHDQQMWSVRNQELPIL